MQWQFYEKQVLPLVIEHMLSGYFKNSEAEITRAKSCIKIVPKVQDYQQKYTASIKSSDYAKLQNMLNGKLYHITLFFKD